MLNEKMLLENLKDNFNYLKEYTNTSIKESLPCYRKDTLILKGKDNDFILYDEENCYYNTDAVFDLNKDYALVINGNGHMLYSNTIEGDINIYYYTDEDNNIGFAIALNVIMNSDGSITPNEGKVAIQANKPYSFQIYETDIKYLDNELLQDDVYIRNSLNINNNFIYGNDPDGNGATFNKNVILCVNPTDPYHLVNKTYVDNNLPCRYINKKYITSITNATANRNLFNIEGTSYGNVGIGGAITIDETKDYSLYSYGFNGKEIPLTKFYNNDNILSLRCYFYGGELTITPRDDYTWFYYSKIIDEKITLDYDLTIYEYEQLSKLSPIFLDDNLTASNSISVGRTIADGNIGDFSFACGKRVIASGSQSQAMGQGVKATAFGSHAEGGFTIAEGMYSHAEGNQTTASGSYGSHSEGEYTKATGESSHAEGKYVKANGKASHAEGSNTKADGEASHAEGGDTEATGSCSHAEGGGSKALNVYSHAEGRSTIANSAYSHVEGFSTIASGAYQHVQGKYNIEDNLNKYAHIIGNGTSDTARTNAHTVDWQGNAWYSGNVSIDGTPTEDKDLTTKKYVDNTITEQITSSQATDEEVDTMLQAVLGGDYSNEQ